MRYAFGDYTLDTDTLELTAAESPVEVEPQVFSLLVHLIERRDRVVSKEELLDGIWGDRFVSESALTTRIKQARQAVGDTGQRQAVIKTLHGRGYRFVADVGEASPQRQFHNSVMRIPATRYAKSDGGAIRVSDVRRRPRPRAHRRVHVEHRAAMGTAGGRGVPAAARVVCAGDGARQARCRAVGSDARRQPALARDARR